MKRLQPFVAQAGPLEATLVRSTVPDYDNSADITSGEGARLNGGRWNPIGIAAVYGSFDNVTAAAEVDRVVQDYGFSLSSVLPRAFVPIEVELAETLDLAQAARLNALGVTRNYLRGFSWKPIQKSGRKALTQRIGEACFNLGIEAIIVPSSPRAGANNVVVFPGNLKTTSRIFSEGYP